MATQFFQTSFFLRKTKMNSLGEMPIYLRIYINQKCTDISIRKKILPERWDAAAACAKGNKEDAKVLNAYLGNIKTKIQDIFNECYAKKEVITGELIRDKYLGIKTTSEKSLIEVFSFHNQQMKEKVIRKDTAPGTLERYTMTLRHIKAFMKTVYHIEDIYLNELKYNFITDLEHYLKINKSIGHNSAVKYIKNFKKIIRIAVNNEWIEKDPFAKYSAPLLPVKRDPLNEEELNVLRNKQFASHSLSIVRDVFLFSCYTGLAYADVQKLSKDNISIRHDGKKWIYIQRTKTDSECRVPLLPQALELIDKYANHTEAISKNRIFPVRSNQKMNEYLKDIADLCEINKKLTYHVARHTFATTFTLSKGVSIESVSAMLGHRDIRTTQHYAKIVDQKLSMEMEKLRVEMEAREQKKEEVKTETECA